VKNGVLVVEECKNPANRKTVQGLRVEPTKRPGGVLG
jgi:hypothetical protein